MKMTIELAEKIHDKIAIVNEKVPCINNGGCGVFAVILAKQLHSLGFNAKVYGLIDTECSWADVDLNHPKENNRLLHNAVIKKTNYLMEGAALYDHYCVGVDGIFLDSTQVSMKDDDNDVYLDEDSVFRVIIDIPLKDIEYASFFVDNNLGYRPGWNPDYNSENNSIIEDTIKTQLKTIPQ